MATTFDLTLGCLLIASWANMILFTLEVQQIIKYFSRYKRDPMFNKIIVLIALAGDILGIYASLAMVYYHMVSHWGDVPSLTTQPWTYPAYVVSIGITGGAVQIFLTRMTYKLTKQWFWIPVIGSFIMVVFVGAGLTAAHLIVDSSLAQREKLVTWATLWFGASVATDTLITIVLVAKFQVLKTRIAGTVTGDLLRPAPMVEMTIGRVYSLCMLSNLNSRSWLSDASSSGGGIVSSKERPSHHRSVDPAQSVVQVHREVDIRMDPLEYGRRKQGDAESLDDGSATSYPNAAKYVAF
ncbi:hypothetical protein B0H16DRAFT_1804305 [Mycena metata]|uniref:Uncharacterized protein n=1 Tax=Mycena metata TaxID=1033252 RepID=A0AAD7NJS3_9AGAR|nr:hypothetical protein B0H16DRAFT_1816971 [Mycena metata]KAJ7763310.1 hypothetical protein B0H16DRAFT_1804305 [Mycena metata]